MILSTYENGNRLANVCKQGGEYVIMCYEDSNYIKTLASYNEQTAEDLADDWILNEIKS